MTQDKKNNQSATEHKQAGEVLRKSDRKLRAALDATPFPIAVVDVEDNNILYWSHSALELFGHTAPTAPEWYEIAYPDPDYRREVIDRWKPFLKIAADKPGQPVNAGEYQVTCKDGSVRICELYATFLPDTLIVTFNDITERNQAEQELLQSKKRYQLLTENAADMIYKMSIPDGKYEYVSPAAETIFGYTPKEFYDSPILIRNTVHPDWRDYFAEQWEKLIAGEMPPTYEYQIIHRSGEVKWLNQRNFLVRDDAGAPVAIEGIVTDITERKQAEQELRQYERIVSTSKDMMALMDERYRFIAANKAYQETFQLTKRKLVGKTAAEVLGEDFFNSNIKPHADRCLSGEVVNFQNWTDLPAYGLRYIDISYSPYYDADNKISGYVVNGRDITERKQAEDDLKESHDRFKMIFDAAPT